MEGRTWRVDGAVATVGEEIILLDKRMMGEGNFEKPLVVPSSPP